MDDEGVGGLPLTQSWYHIVVLGTDLAGVVFAALAARIGYRVLVIGHGARPTAYKHQGYWFLRRSEHLLGFSTSPAVQRAMGDLSLGMEMKNRPQPLEPAVQVAMPGMRLDVGGARRLWERDVERELPGMLPAVDAFDREMASLTQHSNPLLGGGPRTATSVRGQGVGPSPVEPDPVHLPPRGFRERSAFKRLAADIPAHLLDGPFDILSMLSDWRTRTVVEGPLAHLCGLATQPLAPLVVARLWTHLRAGLYRFPGGLDGLKQVFLRKLRDQSSDFRPTAYAKGFVFKRGRIVAVQLASRNESVGCELVVGNVDPRRVLALVPREERDDAWHAALTALLPAAWRLVINLGVDPQVVPRGMAPELVWIDAPQSPVRPESTLWVSRPGVGVQTTGDGRPGPGVLQVNALLDARGAQPTLGGIQRTVARTLATLRRLIPWLEQHTRVVHVPALVHPPVMEGDDDETPARLPEPTLDLDELTPIFGRAVPETLGASAFPPETAYKNLLLAGDQLFAGLGFEGTCLAALQALSLARERVKLKTGLRGDRGLV